MAPAVPHRKKEDFMSKRKNNRRISKKMWRELAFIAALDSAEAAVDTSEISEVKDWSKAITGGFYGAFIKKPSNAAKFLSSLSRAFFRRPITASKTMTVGDAPVRSSSYAQTTDSQLIEEWALRMTEGAMQEFIRRF